MGDFPGGPGVPVPEHGAWLRRGISRNGGPLIEDREVVWLQAYRTTPTAAASPVRRPSTAPRCASTTSRASPAKTPAAFRWEGAHLVERGTNPDGSTFLEIWTPLPGADGATGSWSGPDHHVVRVGRHVVHVDSRAGTYWRL